MKYDVSVYYLSSYETQVEAKNEEQAKNLATSKYYQEVYEDLQGPIEEIEVFPT